MTEIPEAASRARQMYAEGVDTRTILAETGLSLDRLYHWLDGAPQRDAPNLLSALPRRRVVKSRRISAGDRRSLIARMMRSAEQQVAEIEQRAGGARDERDKDARTLAVLARTMRELTATDALNRELESSSPASRNEVQDDDRPPTDIDEFRSELARRIDALVASRTDGGISDDPE